MFVFMNKMIRLPMVWILFFCSFVLVEICQGAYLDKVYDIPDYLQTDSAYGGLPGGGTQYCAPVAVSNSMMWLDDHGFPDLASNTSDRKKDQFDVAQTLGSSAYLNTSLIDGNSAEDILLGVKKYILSKGYNYTRLQYQGWRYHSSEFSTNVNIPDLEWIQQGLLGNGSVWLNIGWYEYDSASDVYTRIGGHWVTLVGYGSDGVAINPDYLIVHDPSPRAGSTFANEYVLTSQISSGKLQGNYIGLPRSAAGFLTLSDGMHIKSTADYGIIDGVIVLDMPLPAIQKEISFSSIYLLLLNNEKMVFAD
ncbi:hypothetical protein [Desulfogranum japonicum]|uniref:hypothetical protein n=1 Tax=Desulfogranum japonicum TaxID=231447 RepID=UPI0004200100|nr:hypothetical protein [Desulfogranum japonicum]